MSGLINDPAFEAAWAKEGRDYGEDALEQVHLGWEMARARIAELETQIVLAHEFDAWNEEVPRRLVPAWRARNEAKAAKL